MDSFLQDGLFVVTLLAGSATCVALCLWLAQRLNLHRLIENHSTQIGTPYQPAHRLLRTGLGLLTIGVSVIMMLGVIPGANFLNSWTSFACVGSAILGILTVVSAQRTPQRSLAQTATNSDEAMFRKAA